MDKQTHHSRDISSEIQSIADQVAARISSDQSLLVEAIATKVGERLTSLITETAVKKICGHLDLHFSKMEHKGLFKASPREALADQPDPETPRDRIVSDVSAGSRSAQQKKTVENTDQRYSGEDSKEDQTDSKTFQSLQAQLLKEATAEFVRAEEAAEASEYNEEMALRGSGQVAPPPKLKEDSSFKGVFANDTDLGHPIYDVEDFYKAEGCAQQLARSGEFNAISSLMICFNAVFIGVDADHNDAVNLYDAHWVFITIENCFGIYFVVEWIIRVHAFQTYTDCFRDGWMRFDSFLVGSMVGEMWVLMPILKLQGGGVN
jgi:hypothetical protein